LNSKENIILPDITVILPVYNGGNYLKESVNSVLAQDHKNFELLIIDDCSSDNSYPWLQSLQDGRICLFKNENNRGLFYNLNFLAGKAKSRLVKLWAQDDIMYPNCLSSFVAFHKEHDGIGFSYSGRDIINASGQILTVPGIDKTPSLISPDLHARIAFFTGSIAGNIANVCISKTALDAVGPFNESMKISADFDMWVRLAKNNDTGFIRASLIQLRDHSGQLSRKESLYINHVRDDLTVYKYLINYVSPEIKKEGRFLLRNHKLVFYYTLMLKALLNGNISNAFSFYKELSNFDNFFVLSYCFVKSKLFGVKIPSFAQRG
jgi:glycosyltransferase involved in cell wall biosynthesis